MQRTASKPRYHAGLSVADVPDARPYWLFDIKNVNDDRNLDRRSIATGRYMSDILSKDASFAIMLAARMMGKPQFRLDASR